ncbi:hypothetical protein B1987_14740 [Mycobacterium kansasii]|nr:hypothetical protein B1987_14740 [Mycobacterium kansasii]
MLPLVLCSMVIATLVPARGAAADILSIGTKVAVASLFFLHGARLSPEHVWNGIRQWQLHLMVLAATFVIFPVLGAVASAWIGPWLGPDLRNGLLYMCLVPSAMQSSIAITSVARGNVPAAVIGASLSNILGVLFAPLLVMLLMDTTDAAGVNGAGIRAIVFELLVPFLVGQLARPWITELLVRRASVLKRVDRGVILLLVYSAYSIAVVEGIWGRVDTWRLVAVTATAGVLLTAILLSTATLGRLAELDSADAAVLMFCGSIKGLSPGLSMALVLFPATAVPLTMLPLMLYYQLQLIVCALIASRLGQARQADPSAFPH